MTNEDENCLKTTLSDTKIDGRLNCAHRSQFNKQSAQLHLVVLNRLWNNINRLWNNNLQKEKHCTSLHGTVNAIENLKNTTALLKK